MIKDRRSRRRDSSYNEKMQETDNTSENRIKISGWLTKLEIWADELLEKADEW